MEKNKFLEIILFFSPPFFFVGKINKNQRFISLIFIEKKGSYSVDHRAQHLLKVADDTKSKDSLPNVYLQLNNNYANIEDSSSESSEHEDHKMPKRSVSTVSKSAGSASLGGGAHSNPNAKVNKRGFIISTQSLTHDNSNLKRNRKDAAKEQKQTIKWLNFMKNWEASIRNRPKILKHCDRGIPDSVRGAVWKLLAGISVEKRDYTLYHKLLEKREWEKEMLDQIKKDITRTMPDHVDFQENGPGQTKLLNVLLTYSVYKPEVGYCQGMGFITAMLLLYMPEEDAFWMLDAIADNYEFAGLWEERLVKVSECMETLTTLMSIYTPKVQDAIVRNFPLFFIIL